MQKIICIHTYVHSYMHTYDFLHTCHSVPEIVSNVMAIHTVAFGKRVWRGGYIYIHLYL